MFRKAWQELKRNKGSYFVSFLVINVSVTLLLFFAFIYHNLYLFSQRTAKTLALTVYLKPGLEVSTRERVLAEIRKLPGVERVRFVSSEKVLAELRKLFKDSPEIMQEIDLQALPPFVEVTFHDPLRDLERAKPHFQKLESLPGVLKVRYAESWLGRINSLARLLKFLMILGGLFLLFSMLFLMTVTITLTLERQREEIEILSLLGATPGYIARPKLFLSFIIGIFSSLLALGVVMVLKNYLERALAGLLPFYDPRLVFFAGPSLIILVGGVGLFCVLVSWFSVRRYLS